MNSMNKITSKEIFKENKILSPKYFSINSVDYSPILIKRKLKNLNISYPLVVKPSDEGSSIGVRICKSFKILKKEIPKNY